jgi:hypothetical protein
MYYQSRRNFLKNWLGNTNLKPYIVILASVLLVITVILIVGRQQIAGYFSAEKITEQPDAPTEGQDFLAASESAEEPDVTGYYIKVNKFDRMVSVWNTVNGEIESIEALFYASVCSTLENGNYAISEKNAWRMLGDYTYVQYSSKDASSLLFHSAQYELKKRSYMIVDSYRAIGVSDSDVPGITLTVAAAKWIFENCPEGTVVEVCEDNAITYGIEAQDLRDIPEGVRWDPTDPDSSNVWVSSKIDFLKGVTDKTITVGQSIDPWDGVYAKTVDGENVTNCLTIHNYVNTEVPGTYSIEYILVDLTGQVIRQYSTVTVVAAENGNGNDIVNMENSISDNTQG